MPLPPAQDSRSWVEDLQWKVETESSVTGQSGKQNVERFFSDDWLLLLKEKYFCILDRQNSNLAGVEDQLDQLRHEGVSKRQGLKVGVHQRSKQHWQQMPQHSGLGYLFQAFQPEDKNNR